MKTKKLGMEREMMGKRVTVTKQFVRTYKGKWCKWETCNVSPQVGWVVGFRTIYDGYMDVDFGEYGEQLGGKYFVQDGHHKCVLVSFSPRQNPVRVPMDGFEFVQAALDAAGGE